jgi:pilus assembly protein CpaB
MNGRSLTMLGLAVILGLGAMQLTRRMMTKPASTEEESQDVIVAARDFKEEEILKADMVKVVRMAKSNLPVGAYSSFKDVEGRWVRTAMLEGDPIVEKKLGPKGAPPGLVSNIPRGMRAFAIEVNEQSGVSGFILPQHHVDVVRYDSGEKGAYQRGETILQNVLVLAAGQVFTRPDEKNVQSRTVTLAVTPDEVDTLVAAKSKGPLSLSLRGVNDHDIVARPKPKAVEDEEEKARRAKLEREREEEKAQRIKLEKELGEVKVALAKNLAEPPPRSPKPKPPPTQAAEPRWVYVYRPLSDKKNKEYPERIAANKGARELAESRAREDEATQSRGFGGPALTDQQTNLPTWTDTNP